MSSTPTASLLPLSGAPGRRGIVTGGTWCLDRNKMIEFWPDEDGVMEILHVEARGGGSGCNLAIDIKKLDPTLPVETIGLIGDDDDGRTLLAQADAAGIDRRQLRADPAQTTQYVDAYGSKRSGRRTHIFFAGAAAALSPDDFDFAKTKARILHLGLPGVHKTMDAPWRGEANGWVSVLKAARAAGLLTNLEMVSVEPALLAALVRPCLPHLDALVVNDHEIGAIAGETTVAAGVTHVGACRRAAAAVLEAGSIALVVVHFPRGAIAVTRDGATVTRPSVRVPPDAVVSANGAGDAFAAGMLYGLHEGWDLDRCLSLAHASAAASLRALATSDAVETWQACMALAEAWGWREAIED